MKIQGYGITGLNPYQRQQQKSEAVKANNISFKDQLEISPQAKDLQVIKSYDLERADRVTELKKQIQDGTYQVDTKKLAQDLLNYYRKS